MSDHIHECEECGRTPTESEVFGGVWWFSVCPDCTVPKYVAGNACFSQTGRLSEIPTATAGDVCLDADGVLHASLGALECPWKHEDIDTLYGVSPCPVEDLPTECSCGKRLSYAAEVCFVNGDFLGGD